MRGYSKYFSCRNSLLPAKKVIVPMMKTENKNKNKRKKKKKKKKPDTVLASRAIQPLVGLLFQIDMSLLLCVSNYYLALSFTSNFRDHKIMRSVISTK